MNFIVAYVNAAVVHYYAVLVVVDLVELYPAVATLYAEDTLRPRLEDLVCQNHSVG